MSKPLELLTLRANAPQFDPAQGEAGLPKRILVLAWGSHETTKGLVVCNETTMRELLAYNASQNWDRPYLDYEHNTIPGSPAYKGEPCDIAGRSDCLQLVSGEGVYFVMPALSNWTESGKKNALAGNYPDLSPVVKVNDKNEVIGLHSAALCRHGATPGLVFLSAAGPMQNPASRIKHPPSTTTTMTPEQLIAKLAEMLGIADATPEAVLAALTEKLSAGEKELSAAKAEAEKNKSLSTETVGDLKALNAQLTEMREQLKTLSATQLDSQRGEIIAQATREGKAVPSVAKTMGLADLKQLCAELPVTIPLDKRTPEMIALSTQGQHETAEQKAVSEMTGVSDEDRKKYANR